MSDGAFATTGAPIIASGSYTNSPTPAAGQAVGVYRLLGGQDYDTGGGQGFPSFQENPPAAVAPSTYNQTEASDQVRVAYGLGMSAWCAQCHPDMHSDTAPGSVLVHPVDQAIGSDIKDIYDHYVSSGIYNVTGANPYLSLVPFEENSSDFATLKLHASNTDTYLDGPATNARASCLSCHRAHASGWEYGLRWNMEGEFMTYVQDGTSTAAWPGTDTTPSKPQFARGRTSTETQAAYYDRSVNTFGAYQRVLCNKCHGQD
jgi:cytochrome c553